MLGPPGMDTAVVVLDGPLMHLAPGHLQPQMLSEEQVRKTDAYFSDRDYRRVTQVMLEGMAQKTSVPKGDQQSGDMWYNLSSKKKVRWPLLILAPLSWHSHTHSVY